MTIIIREMMASDWPAVAAIYREGIDTGQATFEISPPASWEDFTRQKIDGCSLAAADGEKVLGWGSLSRVSTRRVYVGVAEVSVYVAATARGKGIGDLLLESLIQRSEACGIWTLQAGLFPENTASLRLHLKHGFRKVGRREKLGRMEYGPRAGAWRDVLLLERRSRSVAV